MQILGLTITRTKSVAGTSVPSSTGWWPIVREPYTGAWQRNDPATPASLLAHHAVYACVSLIASDIAKMRLRLVAQDTSGIWVETQNPAYSPVLRRPNDYQNRIKFIEWWVTSKLIHGNTYVLKRRDLRGVVTHLYVLDPSRVRVLIAPDGSVFYQLSADALNDLTEPVAVPAREIIHDIMSALYHPLAGISPLAACAIAATQGLKIQDNSTKFFTNGSQPGGVLTAPGAISQATADRAKAYWETNFAGDNVGKVAVLGDGLKYEPMSVNAHDSQLIEQLKWTSETVCSAFHVPPYMIGVGPAPSYNNIQALNQQYYSQCLQIHIESLELALDEGLEMAQNIGTEFDLDDLLRMDSATMMDVVAKGVGAAVYAPDEGRKKFNLGPVPGGSKPYLQQQNFSLEALARRDENPAPSDTSPSRIPAVEPTDDEDDAEPKSSDKGFTFKPLPLMGAIEKRLVELSRG